MATATTTVQKGFLVQYTVGSSAPGVLEVDTTLGDGVAYVAGMLVSAAGKPIAVADSSQARFFNGTFCLDANGRLIYKSSGTPALYWAGMAFTSNGSLCISNGTPVTAVNGLGLDSSQNLVVTGAP